MSPLSLTTRLHVCHACPSACPPPRRGACRCAGNGRDILENAAAGVCPLGRFAGSPAGGARGLGDTIKALADATGLTKLTRAYERRTGRPCGCAARQEALNRLVPYKPSGEPRRDESSADRGERGRPSGGRDDSGPHDNG